VKYTKNAKLFTALEKDMAMDMANQKFQAISSYSSPLELLQPTALLVRSRWGV